MNELARINPQTVAQTWTPRQLDTIKRTVAKDCNDDEFSLFIEYCRVKHLDPFSRQVIAIVFNKDKPDKRQMTIITTQDGLRVMAARCGDYRPAETEPEYVYDDTLKGPTNPLGILKCSVKLWKQDAKTEAWHPVNGTAYWDEFVSLESEWAYDQEAGRRKPTGQQKLADNWRKMGRVMIAKCATAQALRAGWPTVFSGVYGEDEMERAVAADLTASELVERERETRRAVAVGMTSDEYPYVDPQGNLHFIPAGAYGDKLIEEACACPDAKALEGLIVRNREGFNRYWVAHKNDALIVKRELEAIGQRFEKVPA